MILLLACLPCLRPIFLWVPGLARSFASRKGTTNAPSGYSHSQYRCNADGKDILLSAMQPNDGFAPPSDVTVVYDVSVVSERITSQHNFRTGVV